MSLNPSPRMGILATITVAPLVTPPLHEDSISTRHNFNGHVLFGNTVYRRASFSLERNETIKTEYNVKAARPRTPGDLVPALRSHPPPRPVVEALPAPLREPHGRANTWYMPLKNGDTG